MPQTTSSATMIGIIGMKQIYMRPPNERDVAVPAGFVIRLQIAAGDSRRYIEGQHMTATNSYSRHWFEFFHEAIEEGRTKREAEFICAIAPLPEFRRVLDVCCGMGRHARELAGRGYSVTGIERDAGAITKARQLDDGPHYVHADVREYRPDTSAYDLAIVMSQSFGYFDSKTNRELLARIASALRQGGRVVLDLWNPEF